MLSTCRSLFNGTCGFSVLPAMSGVNGLLIRNRWRRLWRPTSSWNMRRKASSGPGISLAGESVRGKLSAFLIKYFFPFLLCFRINSIRELNFNEMIKIFSDHKLLLAAYLILAPLNAITSISFSLSLTPLIGAATQLDGSLFVQAVLACLCIAGLDLAVALLCKYVQLRWIQSCMDTLRQTLADGILQGDMNSFRGQDISGYISMFSNDASRLKETYFESLCGIYENSWSFVF